MESVIRYTDELVREGFVRTAGYSPPFCRKKSRFIWQSVPEGGYFLGLRFTPAEMSGGRVGFCGKTLSFLMRIRFPDKVDAHEILERLLRPARADLQRKWGNDGISCWESEFAVPGLVDRENGIGIRYVNGPRLGKIFRFGLTWRRGWVSL